MADMVPAGTRPAHVGILAMEVYFPRQKVGWGHHHHGIESTQHQHGLNASMWSMHASMGTTPLNHCHSSARK